MIQGHLNNPSREESFSADAVKVKLHGKDMKIKELQGTRDLLLFIAVTIKMDLSVVFSCPLTPVPMSFAHVDGTFNKTDKSKLLKKLEAQVNSSVPEHRLSHCLKQTLLHCLAHETCMFFAKESIYLC